MTHFRAGKQRSGDAPERANRSATVGWAVSVALHALVLALAIELRIGLHAAIAAAADSISRARDEARAASDWMLKIGVGSRLGVSPMRVHLGLFEVPVPVKVVSLRDFDPLLRTRRLMLDEVYEQRGRAVRDSIVTESIAAIRSRSKERARSPQ